MGDTQGLLKKNQDRKDYSSMRSASTNQLIDSPKKWSLSYLRQRALSEVDLLAESKIFQLEAQFRRKLYDGLPFIAAFGMTGKESRVKRAMSTEGLLAMRNIEEMDVKDAEVFLLNFIFLFTTLHFSLRR
jgi:hypothetical protein